jgi:cyclophilin family peptidyl-prolyl cis-trans isomerase
MGQMKRSAIALLTLVLLAGCASPGKVTKRDYKKDVLIQTTMGDIVVRLSDLTPLHRDNFIRLVKQHYFDGLLFHRVINYFMIQGGDPDSRNAPSGKPLGDGGPGYTIPAEFNPALFHKKGVIAAAREGDDVNPQKASSASQFYLTQGKVFTNAGLDSLENGRLKGRKIPENYRAVYTMLGGVPHLDGNYTVFGEVIKGVDVIDKIAAVPTSKGKDKDRPLQDVKMLKVSMIKRIN